jgi:hypothetical protein
MGRGLHPLLAPDRYADAYKNGYNESFSTKRYLMIWQPKSVSRRLPTSRLLKLIWQKWFEKF